MVEEYLPQAPRSGVQGNLRDPQRQDRQPEAGGVCSLQGSGLGWE